MKSLDEITKELQEKQNAIDAEVKDLDLKIEMQDSAIREHEREMATASDAGNVGEYVASKQERQKALDEKEMYVSRRDKLTKKGIISEEEYKKITDEIVAGMDKKVDAMTEKVSEKEKEFSPFYDELEAEVLKTRRALNIAYNMCYKGEKPKDSKGYDARPRSYNGHTGLMIELKSLTGRSGEKDF